MKNAIGHVVMTKMGIQKQSPKAFALHHIPNADVHADRVIGLAADKVLKDWDA